MYDMVFKHLLDMDRVRIVTRISDETGSSKLLYRWLQEPEMRFRARLRTYNLGVQQLR